jgi:hypothetical protein
LTREATVEWGAAPMATPAGRSLVERTLVELAAELQSSPALWSIDTGGLRMVIHRHCPEEVPAALARVASGLEATVLVPAAGEAATAPGVR